VRLSIALTASQLCKLTVAGGEVTTVWVREWGCAGGSCASESVLLLRLLPPPVQPPKPLAGCMRCSWKAAAAAHPRRPTHPWHMKSLITRWKVEPLKCRGLPERPTPFSPAAHQRRERRGGGGAYRWRYTDDSERMCASSLGAKASH
jgi:hypothetical protein